MAGEGFDGGSRMNAGTSSISRGMRRFLASKEQFIQRPVVHSAGVSLPAVSVGIALATTTFIFAAFLFTLYGWWRRVSPSGGQSDEAHLKEDVWGEVPQQWNKLDNVKLEDIKIESALGMGAFGTVYKGSFQGFMVAVKVIEHDGSVLNDKGVPLEAFLSQKADHPNIVKTYLNDTRTRCGVNVSLSLFSDVPSVCPECDWQQGKHFPSEVLYTDDFSYQVRNLKGSNDVSGPTHRTWIVMEFCDKGSLRNAIADGVFFLDKQRTKPKISTVLLMALDIASGLQYLHANGIIHGDVKAENVLLKSSSTAGRDLYCKVGDFGLSRSTKGGSFIHTFTCGTVRYMPPELLKDGVLTPAADVYSFGYLLWELLTGKQLHPRRCHVDIIVDVVDGKRPHIPPNCPLELSSLIQDCWKPEHDLRPTFEEIARRVRSMLCTYSPLHQQALMSCSKRKSQMKESSLRRLAKALSSAPVKMERAAGFIKNVAKLLPHHWTADQRRDESLSTCATATPQILTTPTQWPLSSRVEQQSGGTKFFEPQNLQMAKSSQLTTEKFCSIQARHLPAGDGCQKCLKSTLTTQLAKGLQPRQEGNQINWPDIHREPEQETPSRSKVTLKSLALSKNCGLNRTHSWKEVSSRPAVDSLRQGGRKWPGECLAPLVFEPAQHQHRKNLIKAGINSGPGLCCTQTCSIPPQSNGLFRSKKPIPEVHSSDFLSLPACGIKNRSTERGFVVPVNRCGEGTQDLGDGLTQDMARNDVLDETLLGSLPGLPYDLLSRTCSPIAVQYPRHVIDIQEPLS